MGLNLEAYPKLDFDKIMVVTDLDDEAAAAV